MRTTTTTYRIFFAVVVLLFSDLTIAHNESNGDPSYSYWNNAIPHWHCLSADECTKLFMDYAEANWPGCTAIPLPPTGPWKYYESHWNLRANIMCDFGNGPVNPSSMTFWWYLPAPASCDNGAAAPFCEHTGDEFYLEPPPESASSDCNETNPCNPSDGNKSQVELDYRSSAEGGLTFARYYNSLGAYKTDATLSLGWRHTYSRSIDEPPDKNLKYAIGQQDDRSGFYASASDACTSGWNEIKTIAWNGDLSTATPVFKGGNVCQLTSGGFTVGEFPVRSAAGFPGFLPSTTVKTLVRPNGQSYRFEVNGPNWESALNPEVSLVQSGSNWIFTDADDTEEIYNASGQLIEIQYRNGQTETLDYSLTSAQGGDDDSSTLDRVTGPFGHEITFSYTSGRLDSVTTPDGTVSYAYDAADNLATVTYPDTTSRQYGYSALAISGYPGQLTDITDENGVLFASWEYDLDGRAVVSEHAGGKERVELEYNSNGTTTLTMANGSSRTYTFGVEQGQRKVTALSGDVCSTCPGGDVRDRDYDANGFLSQTIDWEGNVTQMVNNARGLTETLTEAFGTTDQRVTTIAWHSSFRLPTTVTTPIDTTTYNHDTDGNVLSMTVAGGGKNRIWAFTYNANGQPLTMNGPRTDVIDVTTLEYYTCVTGNECGQLKKITNALGHVITYDTYDTAGRLTQMTDPNGLRTSYSYDSRGRLLTATETPTTGTARMTTMTYDDVGQLETLTLPDGLVLTYAYTDARYLTSITDNAGNKIEYGYDEMGNQLSEETYDPSMVLTRALSYTRDLNYRLDVVNDGPVTSDLGFDLVGNLTSEEDGNLNLTQHAYDALNRLDNTVDALSGTISYGYDDHDNLTQVQAANGATTDYVYDALDNLISEASPDRGTTTYTHDDAGNVLTKTDARGITATYGYDALNRLTGITYPTAAENVTYTYDNASAEGIGRLTSMADQSGTTTYTYNEFGELLSDARVIDGVSYTVAYDYDATGRVSSVTYPSGRVVDYSRNPIGEITGVNSTMSSTTKSIITSAAYAPFGPVSNLTYGNGVVFDYDRRSNYQLANIDSPSIAEKQYEFDGDGNITDIVDAIVATASASYDYDALNRLVYETDLSDYRSRVMSDDPIAYWRLSESGGTLVTDETANGYDAGYSGLFSYGQGALAPGGDAAVRVNAIGDGYVDGPTLSGVSLTALELWFNTDATATNRNLIALFGSTADRVWIQHSATGEVTVKRNSSGIVLTSDAVVSSGSPHHLAYWYDAVADRTYLAIDGIKQQSSLSGNKITVTDPKVYVGASRWSSTIYDNFQGQLDEVALYTGSVSESTFANRTAAAGGPPITMAYTYDGNGNRTSIDDGSVTTNYTIAANSNRLTAIGGSSITRDAAGNRASDQAGVRTFSYNDAGRFESVDMGLTTVGSYVYNGQGQRSRKVTGPDSLVYLYDQFGNLLAEYTNTGAHIRDYVWMDGAPVAQIEAGETFLYLHYDHLTTPRLATDDSQTVVWRWDSDAFGSLAANDDPDGDSAVTTVNLRFPGQYFDAETGLHYNYYRTYDPATGRYLESDPIGLDGGLNTYGYVGANSLSFYDHYGLEAWVNAYPNSQGGFDFTATDDKGSAPITGHFNNDTININQLRAGTYNVSPRPKLPNTFTNWLFNRNKNAGRPTISNTDDWNTIEYPNGDITTGAQFHEGRDGTSSGYSLACLVSDRTTNDLLKEMFDKNYDDGGVHLIIWPTNHPGI